MTTPYNPLDKLNLAKSIEKEILNVEPRPLASHDGIRGAGVYVIYYTGDFPAYEPISRDNLNAELKRAIYVGKAIPKGGRKGGLSKDASLGTALSDRLGQHATSIDEATNLELRDFQFRHLVVDDIWIPLGENMLIETFRPIWNRAIDGFGNKDPGQRRSKQYRSPWDVLHPGRRFAEKLADSGLKRQFLVQRAEDYLAGRKLTPLPKTIVEQQTAKLLEAEEGADEAEL